MEDCLKQGSLHPIPGDDKDLVREHIDMCNSKVAYAFRGFHEDLALRRTILSGHLRHGQNGEVPRIRFRLLVNFVKDQIMEIIEVVTLDYDIVQVNEISTFDNIYLQIGKVKALLSGIQLPLSIIICP